MKFALFALLAAVVSADGEVDPRDAAIAADEDVKAAQKALQDGGDPEDADLLAKITEAEEAAGKEYDDGLRTAAIAADEDVKTKQTAYESAQKNFDEADEADQAEGGDLKTALDEAEKALNEAKTAAGNAYDADLAPAAAAPLEGDADEDGVVSSQESLDLAKTNLEAAQKAVDDNDALPEAEQKKDADLKVLTDAVTAAKTAVTDAQGVVDKEVRTAAVAEDEAVKTAKTALDTAQVAFDGADADAQKDDGELKTTLDAAQTDYDTAVKEAEEAYDLKLKCDDDPTHEDCKDDDPPAGDANPPADDDDTDTTPQDTTPDCEGDDCDVEAEGGNTALIVVLVLAALGGIGGAVYCKTQEKMCFAKKDPEGGRFESLI